MPDEIKNCSDEEFINLCFADDSGKKGHKFWDNFNNEKTLNINVWEKSCPKIYNYSKSYDSLPDPDVNSRSLYEAFKRFWNCQYRHLVNEMSTLKEVDTEQKKCELVVKNEDIVLGSDSIMSIYWHRTSGKMPNVMAKIKECIENAEMHEEFCPKEETNYRAFIRNYLKKSNAIGGFIVFPRHYCSINQMRGMSEKIQDRFDLTLECIRQAYENNDFNGLFYGNPLFDPFGCDAKFFSMFGSFKNYVDFFCLNSWVTKDYSAVYDLMSKSGNGIIKEWPEEILPCDFKEEKQQVAQWWTFYNNIMSRLEARNEQIRQLLTKP